MTAFDIDVVIIEAFYKLSFRILISWFHIKNLGLLYIFSAFFWGNLVASSIELIIVMHCIEDI